MVLLIPEINLINYPLFLLLSFRYRIKAYSIPLFLYRPKGRLEILKISDYFDWEKSTLIKSEAVNRWEAISLKFPSSGWKIRIKGRDIDLSGKARRELLKEIEKMFFLSQIVNSHGYKKEKSCIINSLKFDFLCKLDTDKELFGYPTIGSLSRLNVFLDKINLALSNLARSAFIIYSFLAGLARNKNITAKVRYLCDVTSPKELSIDKGSITFSWLADEKILHKKDILFLLPEADFQMKNHADDYMKDPELLAIKRSDMLRMASRKKILASIPCLLKVTFKDMLFSGWDLRRLLLAGYAIRIARWLPLIESFKPDIYITDISSITIEDPLIIYLEELGIKTVMWWYGTNSYLFCTDDQTCQFKNLIFSDMIFPNLIVWNEHFKEFLEGHAQNTARAQVMGPLMSGDENVMRIKKNVLFKGLDMAFYPDSRYVSIFDVPPFIHENRSDHAHPPHVNSAERNYGFIKDISRLLSDFQNIVVIYKPKRNFTSGLYVYTGEFRKLLEEMASKKRTIILDHNINPWIPIAMADICIGMPFESPVIAALHYGKIGLFHDSMNIASHHRYKDLPELLTHSYDELKSRVDRYLYGNTDIKDIIGEKRLKKIQGKFPGENSSDKFREYLRSI